MTAAKPPGASGSGESPPSADLRICGVHELPEAVRQRPGAVISIWDPDAPDAARHLRDFRRCLPGVPVLEVRFHDIGEPLPGYHAAGVGDIVAALRFARTAPWPLLVHCRAGVARSTAVALAILCARHGPGRETWCMAEVARIRPEALPNPRVVSIADRLLGRNGAMARAVAMHTKRYLIGYE